MEVEKRTIWLIIDHPMQIITAIGLALYFKDKYFINLLISRHHYWNKADQAVFFEYFQEIHWFPKVDFSWILPREVAKIIFNLWKIKRLAIKAEDIFLVLSNKVILETILFSLHDKNKRIAINPDFVCRDIYHPLPQSAYQEKLISKIWNLTIFPLFNLKAIIYLKEIKEKNLYAYMYRDGNEKIFYKFFSIVNDQTDSLYDNDIYDLASFVSSRICKNKIEITKGSSIVFFGDSLEMDDYRIQFTNKCLRYIERFFPGYSYIYKPHPNDCGEAASVDLGKFKIYDKKIVAELFWIENLNNTKFCFSIASMATRYSLNIGVTSFYFLKLYKNYSEDYYNALLSGVSRVDNRCFIEDFSKSPAEYKINLDLNKVYKSLEKIRDSLN